MPPEEGTKSKISGKSLGDEKPMREGQGDLWRRGSPAEGSLSLSRSRISSAARGAQTQNQKKDFLSWVWQYLSSSTCLTCFKKAAQATPSRAGYMRQKPQLCLSSCSSPVRRPPRLGDATLGGRSGRGAGSDRARGGGATRRGGGRPTARARRRRGRHLGAGRAPRHAQGRPPPGNHAPLGLAPAG